MKQPNGYLSEKFMKDIWPAFQATLKKTSSKNDYFYNVRVICEHVREDFINITTAQAQGYFNALAADHTNPVTVKTLNTKLSYLRSLYEFILKNKIQFELYHMQSNPFCNVVIANYESYVDPGSIPTLEEFNRMLAACDNNYMMFLIVTLIFRCSLSASEICSLSRKQLGTDDNGNKFFTFNKKGIIRYVKIPEDVMKLIDDYTKKAGDTEFFFHNKRKGVLQLRSLELSFSQLQAKAKLEKKYTLRDLRNASITYMLKAGANTIATSDYAGITSRWMFRYNKVIDELNMAPCDFPHIKVLS